MIDGDWVDSMRAVEAAYELLMDDKKKTRMRGGVLDGMVVAGSIELEYQACKPVRS